MLRDFRRQSRVLQKWTETGKPYSGEHQQGWDAVLEAHNKTASYLHPHFNRKSPKVKTTKWAWQAGDEDRLSKLYSPEAVEWMKPAIEARARLLGPIILSDLTTPEEIGLKLALLSARLGILSDDDFHAVTLKLRDYLNISSEDAGEVYGRAVLSSGKYTLGYLGDISPASFRAYLRQVKRAIMRARSTPALVSRERQGAHPWTRGEPVLLVRLADDFGVQAHQAHQWVRDGKLTAHQCEFRKEFTKTGGPVSGFQEVPLSARRQWEALCAGYYDMQRRKLGTSGLTATEKKQWYRRAQKPGGSRAMALKRVNQIMADLGLSGVQRQPT